MKKRNDKQGGVYYNYDSPINQKIKTEFIERNVGHNISSFVDDVTDYNSFCAWENFAIWKCNECGYEAPNNWEFCPECGAKYPEQVNQEILEYWTVNSWFGQQLSKHGEPILNLGTCYIWGRTTSGQAIMLDSVVSDICYNLEILEGQQNEWPTN
jgi:hypothetical protein